MLTMEAIEAKNAGEIKHAKPEEITAMTTAIVEADKALKQCNQELDLLNDALKQLGYTHEQYSTKSADVRKRLQRLAATL